MTKYPYANLCPVCGKPKTPWATKCRECDITFSLRWKPSKFMPLVKKICQVCDTDFWTTFDNQLYCSELCRRQVHSTRQRQTKYKNRKERGIGKGKLVSWSNTPEQGCTICGESRVFDFAHINKQEVVVLCPNHHRMFDKGIINIDELKDTECADIPGVPIVPLQGVKDKTGVFLLRS